MLKKIYDANRLNSASCPSGTAHFKLGLRGSAVVVEDTFTFRVDLVGSDGMAGSGEGSGEHVNKDGTHVPTPHLQTNNYKMKYNGGEFYKSAKTDAIPMTLAALQRIWLDPDQPTQPRQLKEGDEITLRKPDPGQKSLLQEIVNREGEGMGKIEKVTFLGWGAEGK